MLWGLYFSPGNEGSDGPAKDQQATGKRRKIDELPADLDLQADKAIGARTLEYYGNDR